MKSWECAFLFGEFKFSDDVSQCTLYENILFFINSIINKCIFSSAGIVYIYHSYNPQMSSIQRSCANDDPLV